MRIFDLPEFQENNFFAGNLNSYWISFSSFNVHTAELSHQDFDISRAKDDFQKYDTFHLSSKKQEQYEKTERMV